MSLDSVTHVSGISVTYVLGCSKSEDEIPLPRERHRNDRSWAACVMLSKAKHLRFGNKSFMLHFDAGSVHYGVWFLRKGNR